MRRSPGSSRCCCQAHRNAARAEGLAELAKPPGKPRPIAETVAVINTPYIRRMGLRAGPLARWMLRGRRTKHWMRTIYALQSLDNGRLGIVAQAAATLNIASQRRRSPNRGKTTSANRAGRNTSPGWVSASSWFCAL